MSSIAGKYVQLSKALWHAGFNKAGNTSLVSVEAELVFKGESLGLTNILQQLTMYNNILQPLEVNKI